MTKFVFDRMHSPRAFLVILYYLYGGITRIPLEIADIWYVMCMIKEKKPAETNKH
jgi:hypothetical protein